MIIEHCLDDAAHIAMSTLPLPPPPPLHLPLLLPRGVLLGFFVASAHPDPIPAFSDNSVNRNTKLITYTISQSKTGSEAQV